MMNAVKNRASEISTWLGGVCCNPSALRRNDSTMMMRMNDVVMIRIDGASVITVISTTSWIRRAAEPLLALSPRSSDTDCAKAGRARRDERMRDETKRDER